jgi:phage FluMu protein Com
LPERGGFVLRYIWRTAEKIDFLSRLKPLRLLYLLRHISEKAVCPACKTPLYPEDILFFGSTETSAFLSVFCPRCEEYLFAHAFFQVPEETPQAADFADKADLTAAEVDRACARLRQHQGDLSDLFS